MNFFGTNTIWYVLLGVLTISELIFIFVRAKRRNFVLAYYMTLTGVTLVFETSTLIFFQAYAYFPMILENAPSFDDSLAGNLFSQFSVAATALLVAVFDLNKYWIFLFAGTYGLIEELFLDLGIFTHNWYHTWMTIVGLIIFFSLTKRNYIKSLAGIKSRVYYLHIFIGLFTLVVITVIWGFLISGYQNFSGDILPDPTMSRSLLAVIYYCLLSIAMMLIYFLKLRWFWKALVIIILYCVNYIAYKLNLLSVRDGWLLIYSTVTIFWTYFSVMLLDHLYKEK